MPMREVPWWVGPPARQFLGLDRSNPAASPQWIDYGDAAAIGIIVCQSDDDYRHDEVPIRVVSDRMDTDLAGRCD
jgi:hypothetical protein